MSEVKPGDKERVRLWLQKNAYGFRNARTRANILPFMGYMPDRYWRLCISELIHEGNVASSSSRGYWFVPLVTSDVAEVDALLDACQERSAHALDILRGMGKIIDHWTTRRENLTKQYVFETLDEAGIK